MSHTIIVLLISRKNPYQHQFWYFLFICSFILFKKSIVYRLHSLTSFTIPLFLKREILWCPVLKFIILTFGDLTNSWHIHHYKANRQTMGMLCIYFQTLNFLFTNKVRFRTPKILSQMVGLKQLIIKYFINNSMFNIKAWENITNHELSDKSSLNLMNCVKVGYSIFKSREVL